MLWPGWIWILSLAAALQLPRAYIDQEHRLWIFYEWIPGTRAMSLHSVKNLCTGMLGGFGEADVQNPMYPGLWPSPDGGSELRYGSVGQASSRVVIPVVVEALERLLNAANHPDLSDRVDHAILINIKAITRHSHTLLPRAGIITIRYHSAHPGPDEGSSEHIPSSPQVEEDQSPQELWEQILRLMQETQPLLDRYGQ